MRHLLTNISRLSASCLPAHRAIPLFLASTAILSLQLQVETPLLPQLAPVTLGLQLVILVLALPSCKLPEDNATRLTLAALLLLFGWSLLSSWWSLFPDLVLRRSLLILVPSIGLFLLAATDIKPERTFRSVATFICGLAVFLSVVALLLSVRPTIAGQSGLFSFQALTVGPLTLSQKLMGGGWPFSVSSLTHNPNTFAVWVMLGLISAWGLCRTRYVPTSLAIIAVMFLGFGIWLSFSRGVLGSMAVATAAVFALGPIRRLPVALPPARILSLAALVLAVAVIAGVILVPPLAEDVLGLLLDAETLKYQTVTAQRTLQFGVLGLIALVATTWLLLSNSLVPRDSKSSTVIKLAAAFAIVLFAVSLVTLVLPLADTIALAYLEDSGGSVRIEVWRQLLHYSAGNFMLGSGFGTSFEAILLPAGFESGAFNIYLAILAETGVVGFVLFAGIWAVPIWITANNYRSAVRRRSGKADREFHGPLGCIACLLFAIGANQFLELGIMRYNFLNFFWIAYLGQGLALTRQRVDDSALSRDKPLG